jgi:protein TonB
VASAPKPIPQTAVEITLLREAGPSVPNQAPDAALSQRSQAGESALGDAAVSVFADSVQEPAPDEAPLKAREEPDTPTPEPALEPPPAPEPVSPAAVSPETGRSAPPPPVLAATTEIEPPPAADPLAPRPSRVDATQILASQGREIARLTANLEARSAAYAKRVRRKSVSASTREFKYASYLGAWAHKVERIGNLNYPPAAKEQRLYGSLILHVAVRADGSVERIRVVRSSGFDLLDQAAIQIVELAAPFSPFPPDIAAETDVLDIVRTWQFMRGDVLGWEP